MITKSMQEMLEQLMDAGRIEPAKTYDLMPSGCRGDGYDVALVSRSDESGDYDVRGHLCRVVCSVKVGSQSWHEGIPAGYTLQCDPSAPYKLRPGEKAVVVHRAGTKIGSGYMHRVCASIAIQSDAAKTARAARNKYTPGYLYRNNTPYWIASTSTYASHYRTGMSRADTRAYNAEVEQLESIAAQINATAEKEVINA